MEKVIIADIDCLLNTIWQAVNSENIDRALEAGEMLQEKITKLKQIEQLREASKGGAA